MGKAEAEEVPPHIITEEEEKLIAQLRENVKDKIPEKVSAKSEQDQKLYFVRWIRARENNLEKATKMLTKHWEWRIERKADEIFTQEVDPFFEETYKSQYIGTDKKGRPVFCWPLNEWDFRKVVDDEELLKQFDTWITRWFENIIKILETTNNNRPENSDPITQIVFLYDVKDYPKGQLIKVGAIKKILEIAAIYEAQYPEIFSQGHVINCPGYFDLFMALLKPVIATKTYNKIKLHSDLEKWQEEISEIMDPAIVPVRYGGTLAE